MKSISAFLRLDISATTPPPFNGLFSRTACVSRYQIGKTSVDLNEARDGGVLGCSCISWTIILQTMCTAASIQIYFWGHGPSPEIFFCFWILKWRFVVHSWCNFCSSSKTLRGEKILSPRYIFIGGGAIAPLAPRDRRH